MAKSRAQLDAEIRESLSRPISSRGPGAPKEPLRELVERVSREPRATTSEPPARARAAPSQAAVTVREIRTRASSRISGEPLTTPRAMSQSWNRRWSSMDSAPRRSLLSRTSRISMISSLVKRLPSPIVITASPIRRWRLGACQRSRWQLPWDQRPACRRTSANTARYGIARRDSPPSRRQPLLWRLP